MRNWGSRTRNFRERNRRPLHNLCYSLSGKTNKWAIGAMEASRCTAWKGEMRVWWGKAPLHQTKGRLWFNWASHFQVCGFAPDCYCWSCSYCCFQNEAVWSSMRCCLERLRGQAWVVSTGGWNPGYAHSFLSMLTAQPGWMGSASSSCNCLEQGELARLRVPIHHLSSWR